METRKTIEQQRAKKAWALVQEVIKTNDSNLSSEYKTIVKNAGGYIMTNGLIQTLAFLHSKIDKTKANDAHRLFLIHLNNLIIEEKKLQGSFDLLKEIRDNANNIEYRKFTNLSLAFIIWLKRFVEGNL